jgi:carbon-monoxide dehydrogenase small subunit
MSIPLVDVAMRVNGRSVSSAVEARTTLAEFLREELRLTGTHLGCEHGVCGACTVLLDGRQVRSCLMLAIQANDSDVTTVEGLSDPDGELHVLQKCFQDEHALQCGFCTPGFLMAGLQMVRDGSKGTPTDDEIREAISGNLCRCTGYDNIVTAIRRAHSEDAR